MDGKRRLNLQFLKRPSVLFLVGGVGLWIGSPQPSLSMDAAVLAVYSDQRLGVVRYDPASEICHFSDLGPGEIGFNSRTGRAYHLQKPVEASGPHVAAFGNIQPVAPGLAAAMAKRCAAEKQAQADNSGSSLRNRVDALVEVKMASLRQAYSEKTDNRPTIGNTESVASADMFSAFEVTSPPIERTSVEEQPLQVALLPVGKPISWSELQMEWRDDLPRVRPLVEAPIGWGLENRPALDRAIERALRDSSSLDAARRRIQAARQAVFTRSREEQPFLVTLLADVGIEEDDSDEPILRATASSGVSVTVPLYDGGRAEVRTRAESHGIVFRQLELEEIQARIAGTIRTIYWNAILSSIEQRHLEAWRIPISDWLARARILLAEQLATENDVLALSAVNASIDARLRVLALEQGAQETTWFALTDRSLAENLPSFEGRWPPLPNVPASALHLKSGIEGSIAVRRVDATIAEARDRLIEQKLALNGRLNFEGRAEMDVRSDQEVFIGVHYRLPLYDSGIAASRERELAIAVSAAMSDRLAARDTVRVQVQSILVQLSSRAVAIDASTSALAAARKNLDDATKLFAELPDRLSGVTAAMRGYLAALRTEAEARRQYYAGYGDLLRALDSTGSELRT